MLNHTACVIALQSASIPSLYAVVEVADGAKSLWIGSCRLADVFHLRDAWDNTAWQSHVTSDTMLTILIHATGDRTECQVEASKMTLRLHPVCNVTGMSRKAMMKVIRASNGATYETQTEAAQALGTSQAAISHVLNGRMKAVKGVFLWRE